MERLIPVGLGIVFLATGCATTSKQSRPVAQSTAQAGITRVYNDGQKAVIEGRLDGQSELVLSVGEGKFSNAASPSNAKPFKASVEPSDKITLEDGSLGRGFVFVVSGTTFRNTITPTGPLPFGRFLLRDNTDIVQENGAFTFADIKKEDGTQVPVFLRLRKKTAAQGQTRGA